MIYERLVQWLAGPISILSGWLAVQIVNHWNIFGNIIAAPDKARVAHAIFDSVTFAVGALVTYAAHHKWLDNLSKWWSEQSFLKTFYHDRHGPLPAKLQDPSTPAPTPLPERPSASSSDMSGT